MSICFFGQGTGGNAALWFEFFNSYHNSGCVPEDIVYVCRTPCTLGAKFETFAPYGRGKLSPKVYKYFAAFMARFGLKYYLKAMPYRRKIDGLFLQGNYSPSVNLLLMDTFKCRTVLNVYGSDFYRNYLNRELTATELNNFEEVVNRVDKIVFNWITTERDFIKAFPQLEHKCLTAPWGVSNRWLQPSPYNSLVNWPDAKKVFLSARGVYDYNNIDIVVEAFCQAFAGRPDYKLFVVNGYGNHEHAIKRVKDIVNEYNAHNQVILKIGEWISDEELMALYERADYNFCFGSSDQLTVSINYALVKKTINILSPLRNYYDLQDQGYKSLLIAEDISIEKLSNLLTTSLEVDPSEIDQDSIKATNEFNLERTFSSYMGLFKDINK